MGITWIKRLNGLKTNGFSSFFFISLCLCASVVILFFFFFSEPSFAELALGSPGEQGPKGDIQAGQERQVLQRIAEAG